MKTVPLARALEPESSSRLLKKFEVDSVSVLISITLGEGESVPVRAIEDADTPAGVREAETGFEAGVREAETTSEAGVREAETRFEAGVPLGEEDAGIGFGLEFGVRVGDTDDEDAAAAVRVDDIDGEREGVPLIPFTQRLETSNEPRAA